MTTPHSQPATPPYSGPLNRPSAERLAKANINPATGLATDYLNHFNEAIMLLELVATMPECLPDLMEWRPMSYQDHFAGSAFKDRELAVAAYDAADPVARTDLERLADADDGDPSRHPRCHGGEGYNVATGEYEDLVKGASLTRRRSRAWRCRTRRASRPAAHDRVPDHQHS